MGYNIENTFPTHPVIADIKDNTLIIKQLLKKIVIAKNKIPKVVVKTTGQTWNKPFGVDSFTINVIAAGANTDVTVDSENVGYVGLNLVFESSKLSDISKSDLAVVVSGTGIVIINYTE
jgi:hypothetical protein